MRSKPKRVPTNGFPSLHSVRVSEGHSVHVQRKSIQYDVLENSVLALEVDVQGNCRHVYSEIRLVVFHRAYSEKKREEIISYKS